MTTTVATYDQFVADARADDRRLVVVERNATSAIVRLDDPPSLNALSAPLTLQLHDAVSELARSPEVRTIVLTGTDPAFSLAELTDTVEVTAVNDRPVLDGRAALLPAADAASSASRVGFRINFLASAPSECPKPVRRATCSARSSPPRGAS